VERPEGRPSFGPLTRPPRTPSGRTGFVPPSVEPASASWKHGLPASHGAAGARPHPFRAPGTKHLLTNRLRQNFFGRPCPKDLAKGEPAPPHRKLPGRRTRVPPPGRRGTGKRLRAPGKRPTGRGSSARHGPPTARNARACYASGEAQNTYDIAFQPADGRSLFRVSNKRHGGWDWGPRPLVTRPDPACFQRGSSGRPDPRPFPRGANRPKWAGVFNRPDKHGPAGSWKQSGHRLAPTRRSGLSGTGAQVSPRPGYQEGPSLHPSNWTYGPADRPCT